MPINALLGVFLDANQPSLTAAPATRDYTSSTSRDQSSYTDILLKQPFYIGDGQTSGGATQTFLVPQGATRLYLGTMDGHEWSNNSGSIAATVTANQQIQLVE